MPLILVGADTAAGEAILERFEQPEREIRVFVTDEVRARQLKDRGLKVATGDVSDESHVEAASLRCFTAVMVTEAAVDQRERSFASSADEVLTGWARAMTNSGVQRVIWVTEGDHPETRAPEIAVVDPSRPGFVDEILALDEAHSIS